LEGDPAFVAFLRIGAKDIGLANAQAEEMGARCSLIARK
jgi:hypothetical protein